MTALWTALAASLFIASVAAHEAGHARALRKLGHRITGFGVGLPLPPMLTFTRHRADGTPFSVSVSPWLVGAFVEHDPKDTDVIESAPYQGYAWYAGAGIAVNVVFGGALLMIEALLLGQWTGAAVVAGVVAAVWLARRWFVAYLVPALWIPALAMFIVAVVQSAGQAAGPVATAQVLVAHSFAEALGLAGALSVATGVLNMIPIYPFDGGRIARRLIVMWDRPRLTRWFEMVGFAVAGAFLVYTLLSDVLF